MRRPGSHCTLLARQLLLASKSELKNHKHTKRQQQQQTSAPTATVAPRRNLFALSSSDSHSAFHSTIRRSLSLALPVQAPARQRLTDLKTQIETNGMPRVPQPVQAKQSHPSRSIESSEQQQPARQRQWRRRRRILDDSRANSVPVELLAPGPKSSLDSFGRERPSRTCPTPSAHVHGRGRP